MQPWTAPRSSFGEVEAKARRTKERSDGPDSRGASSSGRPSRNARFGRTNPHGRLHLTRPDREGPARKRPPLPGRTDDRGQRFPGSPLDHRARPGVVRNGRSAVRHGGQICAAHEQRRGGGVAQVVKAIGQSGGLGPFARATETFSWKTPRARKPTWTDRKTWRTRTFRAGAASAPGAGAPAPKPRKEGFGMDIILTGAKSAPEAFFSHGGIATRGF